MSTSISNKPMVQATIPGGVGSTAQTVQAEQAKGAVQAQKPAQAGKVAQAGATMVDSVGRDGTASVAEAPALAKGEAVTPEVLSSLRSVLGQFAEVKTQPAGRADIELPFDQQAIGSTFFEGLQLATSHLAGLIGTHDAEAIAGEEALQTFLLMGSIHQGMEEIHLKETRRLGEEEAPILGGLSQIAGGLSMDDPEGTINFTPFLNIDFSNIVLLTEQVINRDGIRYTISGNPQVLMARGHVVGRNEGGQWKDATGKDVTLDKLLALGERALCVPEGGGQPVKLGDLDPLPGDPVPFKWSVKEIRLLKKELQNGEDIGPFMHAGVEYTISGKTPRYIKADGVTIGVMEDPALFPLCRDAAGKLTTANQLMSKGHDVLTATEGGTVTLRALLAQQSGGASASGDATPGSASSPSGNTGTSPSPSGSSPSGSSPVPARTVNNNGIRKEFESFLEGLGKDYPVDVNAYVQWVLRASYLSTTEDLKYHAEKVKFYNEMKKEIRNELSRAREAATGLAGQPETASLDQFFPTTTVEALEANVRAGMETSPQLTPEQEATLDARKEREALLKEVVERYKDTTVERTVSFSAPNIDSTRRKTYEGGNAGRGEAEAHARGVLEEIRSQYSKMTPDQKAAFLESLKKDGVQVGLSGRNSSWGIWENFNHASGTLTAPADCEDPMAFLQEAIMGHIDSIADGEFGSTGQDTDWMAFDISFQGNSATVKVPPERDSFLVDPSDPSKGTLAELEAELGLGVTAGAATGEEGWSAGQPATNKAELEAYIQHLEEQLQAVGDDAQLANVDLQNILQKQQQTMQMMSNISKMLHDTAMAVIRKIGG